MHGRQKVGSQAGACKKFALKAFCFIHLSLRILLSLGAHFSGRCLVDFALIAALAGALRSEPLLAAQPRKSVERRNLVETAGKPAAPDAAQHRDGSDLYVNPLAAAPSRIRSLADERRLRFGFFLLDVGYRSRPGLAAVQRDRVAGQTAHRGRQGTNSNSAGWALALVVAYCLLIIPASLLGGWLPFLIELTHTRIQIMISLVGGLMLGIGLFHMLPHAVAQLGPGSLDHAMAWMMLGLLGMFFLIRAFQFHQHGPTELFETSVGATPAGHAPASEDAQGSDTHGHSGHSHGSAAHAGQIGVGWVGVAFGLAVHTLIDGMAIAASVQADAAHTATWSLLGLGTFLAVLLHKPLDAVSITSLMTAEGWNAGLRHAVNAGFALMCPLGALLFYFGVVGFSAHQDVVVGCALAFSAGVFVCIALGDLLPELELHSHDRIKLSVALLLGVAMAYAIGFLEPEHVHSHSALPNHAHPGHDEPPADQLDRGPIDAAERMRDTLGNRAAESTDHSGGDTADVSAAKRD